VGLRPAGGFFSDGLVSAAKIGIKLKLSISSSYPNITIIGCYKNRIEKHLLIL